MRREWSELAVAFHLCVTLTILTVARVSRVEADRRTVAVCQVANVMVLVARNTQAIARGSNSSLAIRARSAGCQVLRVHRSHRVRVASNPFPRCVAADRLSGSAPLRTAQPRAAETNETADRSIYPLGLH